MRYNRRERKRGMGEGQGQYVVGDGEAKRGWTKLENCNGGGEGVGYRC